jgi:hypothetical protein
MTDKPNMDGLARLSQLAEDLFDAETDVVNKAAELKAAQGKVRNLAEAVIPEAMEELGMDVIVTKSGLKVEVEDKLSAKKLTHRHDAALKWLRDNNQAGLIKTAVSVPFSAGSEGDADELVEQLAGEGFAAAKAVEVHHSSLAAAIRSMLAEGVDVPMELLGGFQRRVATIHTKKTK